MLCKAFQIVIDNINKNSFTVLTIYITLFRLLHIFEVILARQAYVFVHWLVRSNILQMGGIDRIGRYAYIYCYLYSNEFSRTWQNSNVL